MEKLNLEQLKAEFSRYSLSGTQSGNEYIWGNTRGWNIKGFNNVCVMAAQHGNEVIGVDVLKDILPLIGKINGSLIGIMGNPQAYEAGVRYIDEDMNRVWAKVKQALETWKTSALTSYESKHAHKVLAPHLSMADYLFDIHATINPSDPMILAPTDFIHGDNVDLLADFGINNLLCGTGLLPADKQPVYADSFVNDVGKGFGVTVEGGWLGDPQLAPKLSSGLCSILHKLGKLKKRDIPNETEVDRVTHFNVHNAHTNVPYSPGFTFERVYKNGEEIAAGTLLAHTNSGPVIVDRDSVVFFQKSQSSLDSGKVALGDEVCILTDPPYLLDRGQFWLGISPALNYLGGIKKYFHL